MSLLEVQNAGAFMFKFDFSIKLVYSMKGYPEFTLRTKESQLKLSDLNLPPCWFEKDRFLGFCSCKANTVNYTQLPECLLYTNSLIKVVYITF